jgi:hypothetical protein
LKLAQADAERDLLDDERMQRIRDAIAEIVDDLSAQVDKAQPEKKAGSEAEGLSPLAQLERAEAKPVERALPERWRSGKPVLCIPGPSLLDEAAATMLAHLVERRGIGARTEQADALSMSRVFSLETEGVELICLCYVECVTAAQIRYAIRRIRRRNPTVPILVALFGNAERFEGDEETRDAEFVQQSLREAADKIIAAAFKQDEEEKSSVTPIAAAGDASARGRFSKVT